MKQAFIALTSCNDAPDGNGETTHTGYVSTSKIELYYNAPMASTVSIYWTVIGN